MAEKKMATLKAMKRENLGTRKARHLRKENKVPAIIYGHGETPEAVTLDLHDVDLAIHHGNRLLEIDMGGHKQNVLIKELQYDPMGKDILHMDLARVDLDERVEVTVAIVLKGVPVGVTLESGVLQQQAAKVSIECAVRTIPDDVRLNVAEMKLNDRKLMKELVLPEGAVLKSDPEAIVCQVVLVMEEVVAPVAEVVEEGAAEPEVIGAKKEEEGEGEGEEKAAEEKK